MTAAVGFPTLRLIRWRINDLTLDALGLRPGEHVQLKSAEVIEKVLRGRG